MGKPQIKSVEVVLACDEKRGAMEMKEKEERHT